MDKKDESKKKASGKKKDEVKVHMIQANSLEEALQKLGEELKSHLGGKSKPVVTEAMRKAAKAKVTPEEAVKLNEAWDDYAKEIRGKLKEGKLDGAEACLLGMTIDNTAEDAKTEYITLQMYRLAIEIVEFLDSVPVPEGMDIPKEILEAKNASAKGAAEQYRKRIAELEAPAKAEAEAKEKAHVSAEAGGIFANVSMADILNAPKADNLPDF